MDALAFISAVQSVNVKAWSAGSVPICTSIILPWNTFSPSNLSSIWAWVACTTSRKSICSFISPLNVTLTDSGIGIETSPVASANATVPESAPKATPFDILVCESPPIIIDQSSTVKSFKTLCITSVMAWYSPFGSLPVIRPKSFMKFMSLGIFSWAFRSQTEAVWHPDWYAPSIIGEIVVAAIDSNSCEVIKPVVSCEPTIFTSTLISDPACKTFPLVTPTAFLLNIFSTAVRPWFSCDISLDFA